MTTSPHLNHNNNTTGKQSQNWYLNHSNLHCMISVNFYYGNESHFYTPDCSQTIFQANQYRPTTDHRNLVWPYIAVPILYHLSIKWTEKKNCQHFIESIHESILLSGKQCTWMKVNDFPASPSNQYSLYKLMLLLNVR